MGPYYDHQVGWFAPPDPVNDRDILLARARRARAEAVAALFGALSRGLRSGLRGAAGAAAGLVRHAGAGAALRPSHCDLGHGRPGRLTGCCN